MDKMKLPGFTAEAPLYWGTRNYQVYEASYESLRDRKVLPQARMNEAPVCYTVGNWWSGWHSICICCYEDTELQQSVCGPC